MRSWLWLLLGIAPALADTPLNTDDFAYGLALTPKTAAPVYELELPETVYRQAMRRDLGDIRVFNAAGGVVAHDLYRPPPDTKSTTVPLPFFPLTAEETTPEALSLRLKRTSEGAPERTVVELDVAAAGAVPPARRYLIDARDATRPIRALNLSWELAGQGFLFRAALERHQRGTDGDCPRADAALVNGRSYHRNKRRVSLRPPRHY